MLCSEDPLDKQKMKARTLVPPLMALSCVLLVVSYRHTQYGVQTQTDTVVEVHRPVGQTVGRNVSQKVHRPAEHPRDVSQKYVVYVCDGSFPCGGWADRQKGIVSAFVLATMMGRIFRVQMPSPCDLKTHLTHNDIEWEVKDGEFKDLSVREIKVVDDKANELRHEMVTMNMNEKYPEDVLYFTSNMEYVEYLLQNQLYKNKTQWMSRMRTADVYVHVLKKLFKLKEPLESRLGNFSMLIPREKGVKLVCAQVRLGRNPTVPDDTEAFNTLQSVQSVWDFLNNYTDTSKHRIFVTSDSEVVRKKARELFPKTIIDLKGDIVHVDRTTGSKVCDGFAKVILDQLILSTCDTLIISRSGLARIAAWYRDRADNVFCFSKSKVKACDPYNLTSLIPSW